MHLRRRRPVGLLPHPLAAGGRGGPGESRGDPRREVRGETARGDCDHHGGFPWRPTN